MASMTILRTLRSVISEKMRAIPRGFVRALAVVAIVLTYGVGQVAVTGVMMTASTTSAQAWWRGRGWGWGHGWGRGGWGWGRGWGWGGGRGWCYWHPYRCRGW
jgi:hypothetical protein